MFIGKVSRSISTRVMRARRLDVLPSIPRVLSIRSAPEVRARWLILRNRRFRESSRITCRLRIPWERSIIVPLNHVLLPLPAFSFFTSMAMWSIMFSPTGTIPVVDVYIDT